MTKKTSLIFKTIFLAIFFACCMTLVACSSAPTYAVTWEVAAHATVKVEGYDSLPSEVEEGTKLVFTVTPESGYKITDVKVNNSKISADKSSGKYTRTVKADTKISVTVEEAVTSVVVTQNPDNLTYYAGDVLDKTGMVVTATYGTGRSETITNYTVSPATFAIGDEGFTVSYHSVTSDSVELTKAVTALVTIDPYGGTVDQALLGAMNAREDILNPQVDETTGIITFEYTKLTADIPLPTAEQITKAGKFVYNGWYNVDREKVTSISKDSELSISVQMLWDAILVDVSRLWLENTTHNNIAGAYLIAELTLEDVETVSLYLYEGNDDVELNGPAVEVGSDGTAMLYFNLSDLGTYENDEGATYEGKWMDIRFKAVIDGKEYNQNISLDHDSPITKVGNAVTDGKNAYALVTYINGKNDDLKIVYKSYTTTHSYSVDDTTLTVSGTANVSAVSGAEALLQGAKARLTFGEKQFVGTINTSGEWTVDVDLTQLAITGVSTGNSISLDILAADDTVLMNIPLQTTGAVDKYDYVGNLFKSDNPCPSVQKWTFGEDGAYEFYVGNIKDWDLNTFYAVVDAGHTLSLDNNVELVADKDGKPQLVFTGTYGFAFTKEEAEAAIAENFYLALQNRNNNYKYPWYSTIGTAENGLTTNFTIVANEADRTFTITCDLTNVGSGDTSDAIDAGDLLYGHLSIAGSGNASDMKINFTPTNIVYNGLVYSLTTGQGSEGWLQALTQLVISEYTTVTMEYTNVTLQAAQDGKPQLVVSGTWQGDAATAQEHIESHFYLSIQANGTWVYPWYSTIGTAENGLATNYVVAVNENGTFTVTCDLTNKGSAEAEFTTETIHYGHISTTGSSAGEQNMVLELTEASVTYEGWVYTLTTGQGSNGWIEALNQIIITEATAA